MCTSQLFACAAALFLALTIPGCGNEMTQDLTYSVVRTERTWVDSSRSVRGVPRALRTLIWQPEVSEARPLVVLAHGFGGLPEKFDAFATALAAVGNVVVAPAFPLTNQDTPGGHEQNLGDFRNQPQDIRFLLDRLDESRSATGDPLAGTYLPDDITIVGHSLGGVTTLGLLRHDCCLEPRLRGAVLVSTPGFLETGFGGEPHEVGIPVLVLHGTDDPTVAYQSAPELFASFEAPKLFVGVQGALHSDLIESQIEPAIPARAAAEESVIGFLGLLHDGKAAWAMAQGQLEAQGHTVAAVFAPH